MVELQRSQPWSVACDALSDPPGRLPGIFKPGALAIPLARFYQSYEELSEVSKGGVENHVEIAIQRPLILDFGEV